MHEWLWKILKYVVVIIMLILLTVFATAGFLMFSSGNVLKKNVTFIFTFAPVHFTEKCDLVMTTVSTWRIGSLLLKKLMEMSNISNKTSFFFLKHLQNPMIQTAASCTLLFAYSQYLWYNIFTKILSSQVMWSNMSCSFQLANSTSCG